MPDTHHTYTAFDRDLESVQALLMRMGGLVEVAIRVSERPRVGAVRWGSEGLGRTSSQSSAADVWLRTAPAPPASAAAMSSPRRLTPACPTA